MSLYSDMVKVVYTLIVLLWLPFCRADIHVIVNEKNTVAHLSKKQLIAIYTGRTRAFPNDTTAEPLDQDDEGLRKDFYYQLTRRSLSQINAYWAKLLFTGKHTRPKLFSKQGDIIKAVQNSPKAIAYIRDNTAPAGTKIVFTLKDD